MEGNRDEARRCAALAGSALDDGDLIRARRLASKSAKLFPNEMAEQVLQGIAQAEKTATRSTEGPAQRRHGRQTGESSGSSAPPPQESYTKEQAEHVVRVLRAKDLYQVLNVDHGVETELLKKQYRLYAFKLHPDKNSAPKADEAFKRVSHAFQVLSDAGRRSQYDVHGEEHEGPRSLRRTHPGAATGVYAQEISPEEIFQMFFGGGIPATGRRRSHGPTFHYERRHPPTRMDTEATRSPFFALFPLLVIIVALMVFNLSDVYETQRFSLSKSMTYSSPRRTVNAGVRYYVPKGFSEEDLTQRDKSRLEKEVERSYGLNAAARCREEQLQAADSLKTPNCDEVKRLRNYGVLV